MRPKHRVEWLRFRHTLLDIHTGTAVHDRRYPTKQSYITGWECFPPQQIKQIYGGMGCVIFAALQLPVVSGFLNLTLVLLGLKSAPNESWYKPTAAYENNYSLSHCVLRRLLIQNPLNWLKIRFVRLKWGCPKTAVPRQTDDLVISSLLVTSSY